MGKANWRLLAHGQTPPEGMLEKDVTDFFEALKPLAAFSQKSFCGREISFNENLDHVSDAYVDEVFISPVMKGSLGLHIALADEFFPIAEFIISDIFRVAVKFDIRNFRLTLSRNYWI